MEKPNIDSLGANKREIEPKFAVLQDEVLNQLVGKPRSKVVAFITMKYSGRIPGPAHREYLLKNQDKVPTELKDGSVYYIIGCSDNIGILGVSWQKGRLIERGGLSQGPWGRNDKVLLLI